MSTNDVRARSSIPDLLKRVLLGRAQPTWRLEHTLLPKSLALPILSSDPLSSVAYATEAALAVLLAGSAGAAHLVLPLSIGIAVLLAMVVVSYVQVVKGYPSGGGAYVVARDNLGKIPALTGAAALLVDYVMTVAVSVVAGVVAIVSFAPGLAHLRLEISIGLVVLLTVANLRGLREAGMLFAFPTYAFILSIFAMLAVGAFRCLDGGCPRPEHVAALPGLARAGGPIALIVLMHAFASGATALTGVEAISNAVPIFRRPQSRNAQKTLVIMGVVAIAMFLGVSFLATRMHPVPSEERSVVAQIAQAVFNGGIGFFLVQLFTTLILVLAANTSYQGFPRLLSILANDRFVPRQFRNLGDKLVYSNGIVVLSTLAIAVIWAFDANLDKLIQLYIVGVFTAFTLSQFGMVRHWRRVGRTDPQRAKGWRRSLVINAVAGVFTAAVLVDAAATKFLHGAWIAITAMVLLVFACTAVNRHYSRVRLQLTRGATSPSEPAQTHVVLLVPNLGAATAEALGYVRSFRPPDLHAVYLSRDGLPEGVEAEWGTFCRGELALDALPAGGSLLERIKAYLAGIPRQDGDFVNVVLPEEVTTRSLLSYLVRRRRLWRLKGKLLEERDIVVTDVPIVIEQGRLPVGVDGLPLVPPRTVALVFVSGVHDASVRALRYARSLNATETRAVFFALDPEQSAVVQEAWANRGMNVPLDIIEAPFRDLSGPLVEEVRRYTARRDTVVSVVISELETRKLRHAPLHRHHDLFVKRALLREPRVILSSVPYFLE